MHDAAVISHVYLMQVFKPEFVQAAHVECTPFLAHCASIAACVVETSNNLYCRYEIQPDAEARQTGCVVDGVSHGQCQSHALKYNT